MSGPRALSNEDTRQMREDYAAGRKTQKQLAREFGVSMATVGGITRGHYYREAGGPITRLRKGIPPLRCWEL